MISKELVNVSKTKEEDFVKQVDINSGHINEEIAGFSEAFRKSNKFLPLIDLVVRERMDLSALHFGLLSYSSYKYGFYATRSDRLGEASWEEVVDWCNNNDDCFEVVLDSLKQRSINITLPHRYKALGLGLKVLNDSNLVSVADVGCGFYPLGIDYSGNDCFLRNERGERMDVFSPTYSRIEAMDYQSLDPVWTAVSQWEPIFRLDSTIKKYRELLDSKSTNLKFYLSDVTKELPSIEPVDFCFVANILYQIPKDQQLKVIDNIKGIIKPNGFLLTADFLSGGSRRRPYTYGVCSYPNEGGINLDEGRVLLLLENADCKKVRFV